MFLAMNIVIMLYAINIGVGKNDTFNNTHVRMNKSIFSHSKNGHVSN